MNMRDKQVVYNKVKALVEAWHKNYARRMKGLVEVGPPEGYCLWWAHFGCQVINNLGIRAVLQAGTAYWPRLTPEQDDGKETTHNAFGYQYTPGDHNFHTVLDGKFPEIHCWIGIPRSQVIVDFTTGFWPRRAKELGGYDWPGIIPPPFHWGHCQHLPDGVVYHPHLEAIEVARTALAVSEGKGVVLVKHRPMIVGTVRSD